jgi:hypothetical protein
MERIFGLFLALAMVVVSCTPREKSSIEGTWQLVYTEFIEPPDTTYDYLGEGEIDLLMIGEKYFSFFSQEVSDTDTNTLIEIYYFGTYVFKDGMYTETVEYSSIPDIVGCSSTGQIEFRGDTLVMTIGDIPDSHGFEIKAVYRRLN